MDANTPLAIVRTSLAVIRSTSLMMGITGFGRGGYIGSNGTTMFPLTSPALHPSTTPTLVVRSL